MESVIVSYFPLVDIEHYNCNSNKQELIEYIDKLMSESISEAHTCAWIQHNDDVMPIFVMNKANAIYTHLLTWSDNNPSKIL